MDDIFREVKNRVNILDVCGLLGIKLDRHYKALCPFSDHNEKTASFSIKISDNIFYCFGCNRKGDAITLVSELLNIKPFEAVKFLNNNLNLGLQLSKNERYNYNYINLYEQKRKAKEQFEKWKINAFKKLCDYKIKLEDCYKEKDKKINCLDLADKYFEDYDINKYFNNIDKIDYYIDLFIYGTAEDILEFKKTKGKVVDL